MTKLRRKNFVAACIGWYSGLFDIVLEVTCMHMYMYLQETEVYLSL